MTVRKAFFDDMPKILQIYSRARGFMAQNGNPSQWGGIYPPEELIRADIESGRLYVIEYFCAERQEKFICGVFAFLPEGDEIYNNIEGKWLNDLPHAAIHRVASSGEVRGVLPVCVDFCLSRCSNLKIDTHIDNKIMQHQLKKVGFVPCGTVFLENGDPRVAFQLCR